MGEMTIRLDEALLLALNGRAAALGTDVEGLAADILRRELRTEPRDRAAVARAIVAAQPLHDTDSTSLIIEDRASR